MAVKKSNCLYFHSCVDIPEKYVRDMEFMIDQSKGIAWDSFRIKVDVKDIRKLFPNYYWGKSPVGWDMHIKDDYAVQFCSSQFRGFLCYYIVHSAIEYIWIQTDYKRSAYSKRRWSEPIDWD